MNENDKKVSAAPSRGRAEQMWDTFFEYELKKRLFPDNIVVELRRAFLTGMWTQLTVMNRVARSRGSVQEIARFMADMESELTAKVVPKKPDPLFGNNN